MLVLGRREFETIHIGDSITVTVLKTAQNHVSIGVEAPREIPVKRGELKDKEDGSCSTTG